MALITTEDLKIYLGIGTPADAQGTQLEMLVNQVSVMIESHCNRVFISTAHTEYKNGNGEANIYLKEWPIVGALTSVKYTDPNNTVTTIASTDYTIFADEGLLKMKATAAYSPVWIKGNKCWEFKYTAGYAIDSMPQDIKAAACMWAAAIYKKIERQAHGISSVDVADKTISYIDEAIPKVVEQILKRWVRPAYA